MSFEIQTYNNIAEEGLKRFRNATYTIDTGVDPDGIMLRSQNLHETSFPASVKGIARAGAGVNNIPVEACTREGIVVFNTPGANANAVKELVLASLLLSVRPILKGAAWVQTLTGSDIEKQVEKEKKQFSGFELEGKKLGVVGLGAIGAMIANDAYRLGMDVVGYDPFVSVDTAWNISRRVRRALTLDEVFRECDFITIHVPLNDKTHHLISTKELSLMKNNATLLNFARGELVDNQALVAAINNQEIKEYITDFASEDLLHHEQITVLPHLGASTNEAEINCAKSASRNLKLFLETGNIQHSVNFPAVELAFHSPYRLAIFHKNVPNMLGSISSTAAELGMNIDNLINRSRDEIAYTLLDLSETDLTKIDALQTAIAKLDDVIRLRIIQQQEGI